MISFSEAAVNVMMTAVVSLSPTIDLTDEQMKDFVCITHALHFEGRGEDYLGRVKIANVIQNRVESGRYPDTACEVVYQPSQFSYLNSGLPFSVTFYRAYEANFRDTVEIALLSVIGSLEDLTGGAKHYYAHNLVTPFWAPHAESLKEFGGHTFAVGVP